MNMFAKNIVIIKLIAVLLLSINFTYGSQGNINCENFFGWKECTDMPIGSLLYPTSPCVQIIELTSFNSIEPQIILLPELHDGIVRCLTKAISASNMVKTAYTINSLAQVNRYFNKKINDPIFTQNIIHRLYIASVGSTYIMPHTFRFDYVVKHKDTDIVIQEGDDNKDRSYQEIAMLLQTDGAVAWLKKQKQFIKWLNDERKKLHPYPEKAMYHNVRLLFS